MDPVSEVPEKVDLSQKTFFLTIRPSTDIDQACVDELVKFWKKQKNIQQTYCVIEKQGKTGPCTHHLHAYLHYNVPFIITDFISLIRNPVHCPGAPSSLRGNKTHKHQKIMSHQLAMRRRRDTSKNCHKKLFIGNISIVIAQNRLMD